MSDSILELDEYYEGIRETIAKDQEDVRESETVVEEKIEEEIEEARQAEEEEGEEEEGNVEELEEEEKELEEAQETLEAYMENKVSQTMKDLAVCTVVNHLRKHGRENFATSLENDNSDTEELVSIVKEEREKTLNDLRQMKENRNEKLVENWTRIAKITLMIRDAIKGEAGEGGKERRHLGWVQPDEDNRRHFEVLTYPGGNEVKDIIKTAAIALESLSEMKKFMAEEVGYFADNCKDEDAHLQHAAFIAEWTGENDTLFAEDLIGGFNMNVSKDVVVLEHGALVKGETTTVGEITVSSEVGSVDEDIEGDQREDVKIRKFVVDGVLAVAGTAMHALAFYKDNGSIDQPMVSSRIAIRLLKIVTAFASVIQEVGGEK